MKKTLACLATALAFSPLAGAADLKAELAALEKQFWTSWGKQETDIFKKRLVPDAVEIVAGAGPSFGRDAIVKDFTAVPCELKGFTHADHKLRKLAENVVALTYVATQDATCAGKKMPPKVFSSSIYVRKNGRWMLTQYQETPLD